MIVIEESSNISFNISLSVITLCVQIEPATEHRTYHKHRYRNATPLFVLAIVLASFHDTVWWVMLAAFTALIGGVIVAAARPTVDTSVPAVVTTQRVDAPRVVGPVASQRSDDVAAQSVVDTDAAEEVEVSCFCGMEI